MTQPPQQPPPGYGPPNVTINQKSGCGTAAIIILILFIVGSVAAVLFMGGCLAMFA